MALGLMAINNSLVRVTVAVVLIGIDWIGHLCGRHGYESEAAAGSVSSVR